VRARVSFGPRKVRRPTTRPLHTKVLRRETFCAGWDYTYAVRMTRSSIW